jgi:hypothetical protein
LTGPNGNATRAGLAKTVSVLGMVSFVTRMMEWFKLWTFLTITEGNCEYCAQGVLFWLLMSATHL